MSFWLRSLLAPDLARDFVELKIVRGLDEGLGPGLAVVLDTETAELVNDLAMAESEAQRALDSAQVGGCDGGRGVN